MKTLKFKESLNVKHPQTGKTTRKFVDGDTAILSSIRDKNHPIIMFRDNDQIMRQAMLCKHDCPNLFEIVDDGENTMNWITDGPSVAKGFTKHLDPVTKKISFVPKMYMYQCSNCYQDVHAASANFLPEECPRCKYTALEVIPMKNTNIVTGEIEQ